MQHMPDPSTIPTPRHTARDGGTIQIFHGVSLVLSNQGKQLPYQYPAQSHQPSFRQSQPNFQSNYQHNFQPTYQQQPHNHPDKKMSDLERMIETMSKNQASMMNNHNQAINRLEVQIGQLANSLNERQKGTLPSQPLPNSKNPFLFMKLKT